MIAEEHVLKCKLQPNSFFANVQLSTLAALTSSLLNTHGQGIWRQSIYDQY